MKNHKIVKSNFDQILQSKKDKPESETIYWSINHTGQGFLSKLKAFLFASKAATPLKETIFKELHHNSYGREWFLGFVHFNFLVELGLKQEDHVLEFGCGSGRLGVHLLRYLTSQHYYGIDSHYESLLAFAEYEVVLNHLENKEFQLTCSETFEFDIFDKKFDYIVDAFVSKHLGSDDFLVIAAEAAAVLNEGGRYFLTPVLPPLVDELKVQGFKIVDSVTYAVTILDKTFEDEWIILEK